MENSQDQDQPTISVSKAIGTTAKQIPNESLRVERLPGVHLALEVGSTLAIKLPPGDQKFEGLLVGIGAFSYLIVQTRLPQDVITRLTANPNLVVQHLAAGAVYGFRSEVLNRVTTPAPLLFLAFPDSVERVVLRKNDRVSVSIRGALHGHYGDHEVLLTDLTSSGCQITAAIDLRSPLRDAKPDEELLLGCDLGGGQTLMAPVRLRRVCEAKGLLTLGCQFVKLNEEMGSIIESFVQSVLKFKRD